jgi:Cytosine deaminase and related metal-dependent hydrolases
VQLDAQKVKVLPPAARPCACARARTAILVLGCRPVRELMESGALLCLGTDGLTSNRDLDVRKEAVWLRETMDVPPEALVRMLTVNGAAALNLLGCGAGRLEKGGPADFCVLPENLTY